MKAKSYNPRKNNNTNINKGNDSISSNNILAERLKMPKYLLKN